MSPTHTPRIAVVGSLNMDLVLQVQHAPGPGETVLADALHLVPGGKGGNQAVACARQGARVALFGRVGDDGYGHTLRAGLDADGIDHRGVQTDTATTTGVAAITVEASGQNRIVVVPGANGRFVLDAAALGEQPLLSGQTLLDMAADDFSRAETLAQSKQLLRMLINHTLGGQPLQSRRVLKELQEL